jgi:hypothetical protein
MKINGEVYRQAVRTYILRGFKIRSMNKNDWVYKIKAFMKIINAEYKRLMKARSKREHRTSNKTHK